MIHCSECYDDSSSSSSSSKQTSQTLEHWPQTCPATSSSVCCACKASSSTSEWSAWRPPGNLLSVHSLVIYCDIARLLVYNDSKSLMSQITDPLTRGKKHEASRDTMIRLLSHIGRWQTSSSATTAAADGLNTAVQTCSATHQILDVTTDARALDMLTTCGSLCRQVMMVYALWETVSTFSRDIRHTSKLQQQ